MRTTLKLASLCVALAMLLSLAACSQAPASSPAATNPPSAGETASAAPAATEKPELLEYSYFTCMGESPWWADESTDVVSQYIFDKFNIKVKEFIFTGGMTMEEKITVLGAADSLPDVIQLKTATQANTIKQLAGSGDIAKLDDLITPDKTPNVYKYVVPGYDGVDFLRNFSADRGVYGFPQLAPSTAIPAVAEAEYKPMPVLPWNIIIRSDILRQLGYNFKTYSELEAELKDNPRPLTLDDLKVDPAIATPEDYYQFLKKVKALNLKVGDKDVLPLSIENWQLYHLACLFGSGLWSRDPNGEINGFFGHQYSKDYWQFVRKLYQEGLLDPDFSIQKDEQFIQKATAGAIASTIYWCPGDKTVFTGIVQTNPDYEWVRIPMPHLPDVKPYTDEQIPAGCIFMIGSKFKDVPRLVNYFDWFYSDEAFDVITWGPESADLYTLVDGKKQFKDAALWELIKAGTPDQMGYDYYGLYTPALNDRPGSQAVSAAPFMQYFNPMDSRNSYPYQNDFFNEPWAILGVYNAATDGSSMGNGSDAANAAQNFMWNDWLPNTAALYTAKTDADFEAAWADLTAKYMEKGMYEQAKQEMTNYINGRTK